MPGHLNTKSLYTRKSEWGQLNIDTKFTPGKIMVGFSNSAYACPQIPSVTSDRTMLANAFRGSLGTGASVTSYASILSIGGASLRDNNGYLVGTSADKIRT